MTNPSLNVAIVVRDDAEQALRTILGVRKTSQEIPFCISVVGNGCGAASTDRLISFKHGGIIDNILILQEPTSAVCAANIAWGLSDAPLYLWLATGLVPKENHWPGKLLRFWHNGLPLSTLSGVDARCAGFGADGAAAGTHYTLPEDMEGEAMLIPKGVVEVLGRWNEDYAGRRAALQDYCARMHCAGFPRYAYPLDKFFAGAPSDDATGSDDARLCAFNSLLYSLCVRSWKPMLRHALERREPDRARVTERPGYRIFRTALDACEREYSKLLAEGVVAGAELEEAFVNPWKARFADLGQGSPGAAPVRTARRAAPPVLQDAPASGVRSRLAMHRDALLMPFEGSMDAFVSGVFVEGQCLPESLQCRGAAAAPRPPEAVLSGPCIFGGYLFAHYGHFLLETLNRYYAIARCARHPLLFMSPNAAPRAWQREIFRLLGMSNEMYCVRVPTLVRGLLLAPPSGDAEQPMTDAQFAALGRVPECEVIRGKNVWLSRSALLTGGRVEEEAELEAMLAAEGWEIVHPERLPPIRQAQTLMEAEYVAGFDGSAFYTVLLCRRLRNHFILFSRRNSFVPFMLDYIRRRGARLDSFLPPAAPTTGKGAAQNWSIDPRGVFRLLHESMAAGQ